jgi:hypothetical protein
VKCAWFSTEVENLWETTVFATTTKTTTMNAWDQIKRQLETRISSEAYANWVARTTFRAADGDTLVVAAPDEATGKFMESSMRTRASGNSGPADGVPPREVRGELAGIIR